MNDFKIDLYYLFLVFVVSIYMILAIVLGIKKAEYNRIISTIEHENTMKTLYNEFVYYCDNSGGIIYNNDSQYHDYQFGPYTECFLDDEFFSTISGIKKRNFIINNSKNGK